MSEEKEKSSAGLFKQHEAEREAQMRGVAKFVQGGRRRRARGTPSRPMRIVPLETMSHTDAGSVRIGGTTAIIEHLRKNVMAKTFGVREYDQSVQTAVGGESPGVAMFGQGNANFGLGRMGPGSKRASKMNRQERLDGSGLLDKKKK
jgi:hypothetical protein